MKSSYFNENSLNDLLDEIEYVYLSDERPWIIGYSGGKDSTVVVHLVYSMLLRLAPINRNKHIYVVSSDTMVENPIIKAYLTDMLNCLNDAAKRDGLPLSAHPVRPEPSNTFWANIIGRGFPTPNLNGRFRWCTDRLKINPSGKFIEDLIRREKTEVVVLLGVRKAESVARKKRIEGREIMGRLLNRHETIKQAFVYPPIVALSTEDVWTILMSNNMHTAWGGDNSKLVTLYSDADGECPFAGISSKDEQQQSCGNSRFGCWVCSVVKEDKSLNGFIRSGHRELIPLQKFRQWLIDLRWEPGRREQKMRGGRIYYTKDGDLGYGPFTWETRKEILKELLLLQKKMQYELITVDELRAIDTIWDEELDLTRRTLVELYYEVTGEKLPWHDLKAPLFNDQTIAKIESYAAQYDVPLDLARDMILATEKNKHFSNPQLLRNALDKAVTQQYLYEDRLREFIDEN